MEQQYQHGETGIILMTSSQEIQKSQNSNSVVLKLFEVKVQFWVFALLELHHFYVIQFKTS